MAQYLLQAFGHLSLFFPTTSTVSSHPSPGEFGRSGRIVIDVNGSLESYIVGPRVLGTVTCRLIWHKLATSA